MFFCTSKVCGSLHAFILVIVGASMELVLSAYPVQRLSFDGACPERDESYRC